MPAWKPAFTLREGRVSALLLTPLCVVYTAGDSLEGCRMSIHLRALCWQTLSLLRDEKEARLSFRAAPRSDSV